MLNAHQAATILFVLAGTAHAADQTVVNCANDTELRADLSAMQSTGGGTLTFACSSATIVLTGGLPSITTATSIDGGGTVTLSGGNTYRPFQVESGGSLTLRRITVANSLAATDGGAIVNFGTLLIEDSRFQDNVSTGQSGGAIVSYGPVTIRRSTFVDNSAVNGGALYPRFAGAPTTIEDSVFENNRTTGNTGTVQESGLGGAILAWDGANVTIARSRFTGNTARNGGAYFNTQNSGLLVANSTFASNGGNQIFPHGGAITNQGGMTIIGTTFAGNAASFGGAIENSGSLLVSNSTFSGNNTGMDAIFYNTGTATLYNCTLHGNGLYGIRNGGGTTSLRNTVISSEDGNSATTACAGAVTSMGFNLATDTSCTLNQPGDRQNVPSGLGPLADNGGPTLTHLPAGTSLLVDGGTSQDCPGTDQRGRVRPVGLACDIGAVEAGPELFANGFE